MHIHSLLSVVLIVCFSTGVLNAQHIKVAQSPPMGWSSHASFGAGINEQEVLSNAGFMEVHLKSFGWQYVVIGNYWYYPHPAALSNPAQYEGFIPWLSMDKFGRLLPDNERFPSAAKRRGFEPLAGELHRKGLKFGIQMMRGIPRQAVALNTRIKGSSFHAKDIADTTSICSWLNHMYGVDMDKPGAQDYYNSLFDLYARWGVDFVTVDDISSPFSEKEIIAIRKAMEQCGRPMVLSLSPGETPFGKAALVAEYSDMWRISADFRDTWKDVERMFALLHKWEKIIEPGQFPDADVLMAGCLSQSGSDGELRYSNLNHNELITMMTLWSIARSPLMFGGDLNKIRAFELHMLQNKAVIQVNQNSSGNRQLFRFEDQVAWIADVPGTTDKYLAVFNLGEHSKLVNVNLKEMGFDAACFLTDLWTGDELGKVESAFRPEVLSHGARLFRVTANE